MLDLETRRRIDNARDILVGKVPDPKSQVEQITIALIYKFMDDMDKEAVELGGKATFFKREFAKYSWSNIFDPKLGGHELINLYGEAITMMNQNKYIPQLFRDIFKNAFLPYRDPETLKSFLKEINDFHYDHSERLGDAFEYLLSVLGVQGDAGSLRTPRHIIDFIVEVIAPRRNETILDPSCGTGGFLISSYKHILRQNTDNKKGLTPDDRKRLMNSITGYDISPDMVRLSLVNMYLHGFQTPKIYEYDSLTSDDRWNDTFDIILANPPFMTPKGGIRPHKRFQIQANRSEVLFVDYIMEHTATDGRAGVIVPEGIIFQSGNAYKALRKELVENNYLYAVVSLPAGAFNPYSGVKTSILLMDRTLAKKTKDILFIKIGNDGFDLGAQRRGIDKNDLPDALTILQKYKQFLQEGKKFKISESDKELAHTVLKEKIAESGDYNLTGERYRERIIHVHKDWPMVELGEIAEVSSGDSAPQGDEFFSEDGYPFFRTSDVGVVHISANLIQAKDKVNNKAIKELKLKLFPKKTILFPKSGASTFLNHRVMISVDGYISSHLAAIIADSFKVIPKYLFNMLCTIDARKLTTDQNYPSLRLSDIQQIKIPLPPLSVQQEIVAEIEGYQKIIDGAKQVIENYKPKIKVDESWEMVELGKAEIEIIDGDRGVNYPQKEDFTASGYCLFLNTKNVRENGFNFESVSFISKEKDKALRKGKLSRNDVVLTTRGTVGNVAVYDAKVSYEHIRINSGMVILRPNTASIFPNFLFQLIQTDFTKQQLKSINSGSAQPQLPIRSLIQLQIPLPPLSVQQQIVAQIEEEQKLVEANKKLIEIFEEKIKAKIAEVWG